MNKKISRILPLVLGLSSAASCGILLKNNSDIAQFTTNLHFLKTSEQSFSLKENIINIGNNLLPSQVSAQKIANYLISHKIIIGLPDDANVNNLLVLINTVNDKEGTLIATIKYIVNPEETILEYSLAPKIGTINVIGLQKQVDNQLNHYNYNWLIYLSIGFGSIILIMLIIIVFQLITYNKKKRIHKLIYN